MKYLIITLLSLIFLSACSPDTIEINEPIPVNITSTGDNTTLNINSSLTINDYFVSCAQGTFSECRTIRKFGRNPEVGTSIEPIALSGSYQTPTSGSYLEALSSDANDIYNGSGAWTLFISGLNNTWDEVNETLTLNGTSPSNSSVHNYTRLYRAYVVDSGTYATQTASSHQGDLTVRGLGGGSTWLTIDQADTGFGVGQSQVGVYTIPRGWTGYLLSKCVSIETNQPANVYFFQRARVDDVVAPFSAMRLVEEEDGVENQFCINFKSPIQKFDELTDMGFMGKKTSGSGTASISVDFELLLIRND